MDFYALHRVLNDLEKQDRWRSRQLYQTLLTCWPEIVGSLVAKHTRPTSIRKRVLYVATSSAAWAQNLGFERPRLLQKLNPVLAEFLSDGELLDIRFSTAQWHRAKSTSADPILAEDEQEFWRNHPSWIGLSSQLPTSQPEMRDPASDPQTAFQQWSVLIQQRSQSLPLCPICQCPTPTGELKRWGRCALCAAKQW